jgi:hypothetical protein
MGPAVPDCGGQLQAVARSRGVGVVCGICVHICYTTSVGLGASWLCLVGCVLAAAWALRTVSWAGQFYQTQRSVHRVQLCSSVLSLPSWRSWISWIAHRHATSPRARVLLWHRGHGEFLSSHGA